MACDGGIVLGTPLCTRSRHPRDVRSREEADKDRGREWPLVGERFAPAALQSPFFFLMIVRNRAQTAFF